MKTNKRFLAAIMVAVMIMTLIPFSLFAFAEGTGTEEDPYIIANYAELQDFLSNLGSEDYPNTSETYYKLDGTFDAKDNVETWLGEESDVEPGSTNGLVLAKDLDLNYTPASYEKAGDTYDEETTYYFSEDAGETWIVDDTISIDNYDERYNDDTVQYCFIETAPESWEPVTIDQLDANQISDIALNNGLNVEITPCTTTFAAKLDGNNVTLSNFVINAISAEGKAYAALFVTNSGYIRNIDIDDTCTINAINTDDGVTLYAATFAVMNASNGIIDGCSSAAVINVSNKLYTPKSDTDDTNTSVTVAGGLAAQNILASAISNSTFSGTIDFAYADGSFTDEKLPLIYSKTSISLGAACARMFLATVDECTLNDCTITSNVIGLPGIALGYKTADAKDVTIYPTLTAADKEYYVGSENANDIYGNEVTTTPVNNYQLVIAEKEDEPTVAYIRTKVCEHTDTIEKYTDAVDATCSATGKIDSWKCTECGKIFSDEEATVEISDAATIVEKNDTHDVEEVIAKDATCIEEGNSRYWKCKDCGKYFEDEEYTTPIDDKTTVVISINADNHVACTDETKKTHVAAKAATCTKTGNIEYWKCACGTCFSDEDCTEVVTNVVTAKNSNHVNLKYYAAKAATCTAGGNIKYWYCSDCKQYFKDSACTQKTTASGVKTSKLGHSFTKYVYNKDATTSKDGTKTAKCDHKGCTATKTVTASGTKLLKISPTISSKYVIKTVGKTACLDNVIAPSKAGIKVSTFKSKLRSGYTYIVRNKDGKKASSSTIIATGFTVEISGHPESKVTIIVKGDVNKDGKITSADYTKIKNHITKKTLITNKIAFQAADYDNNGKITSADYTKVKNLILGK